MRSIYSDEVPVAEVTGGMVAINVGDQHPLICTPIHVARKFCEITMRKLDAWEAEQAGRVIQMPPCRKGPPETHG